MLSSGQPLIGEARGGARLAGAPAACAKCHGRSGFGYGEGQVIPPAIAAPILFRERAIRRKELYGERRTGPGTRPAYDDASLARAIRDGVGVDGSSFDLLMPRYRLGDADLRALVAYLHSLGATPSPGVTDTELHLATVVAPGVGAADRAAMLGVLEGFVAAKNGESRHETRRARGRALHVEREQRAYRKWALHVWDLRGPPETWRAQLADRFAAQPVFALLSGLGGGAWRPVHEFCAERELPCILPNTDLPGAEDDEFHTLYFSAGVSLEARVIAKHLRDSAPPGGVVLQVHRDDAIGSAAAAALRHALARERPARAVRDLAVSGAAPPSPEFWREALREPAPAIAVIWLRDGDLPGLFELATARAPGTTAIYLSSRLVRKPGALPANLRGGARLVHPFALPDVEKTRLEPLRRWLRARGVVAGDERIQANTYFAAHAFGESLMHLLSNFSGDYLLEKLEHRLSSSGSASVYPQVSLSAGQRFLSKGAYVVRIQDGDPPTLVAVSEWIVPE